MIEIPLTQGYVALVDEADYDTLTKYKWHVTFTNNSTPYAKTGIFGRPNSHYMHRLITGCGRNQLVDHVNGNGLDNRRCNLRITDKSRNGINSRKRKGCSSRFKGVSWNERDKVWMAYANLDGKRTYLSTHPDSLSAAKAYDEWAKSHCPEVAHLNFP